MTAAEPFVLGPDFLQRPHEISAELRRLGGPREVVTPRGQRVWMVTRHADVRAALVNPDLAKDIRGARERFDPHDLAVAGLEFGGELSEHMLNTDPPDHTRLRKLVGKAFTVRAVDAMRDRVAEIADELLDGLAGRDEVDLLAEFAFPLPITVISELMGVPELERAEFREWSTALVTAAEPEAVWAAAKALVDYLGSLIATKRAEPGDDLLSALIQATDDGDRLTERELVAMAFLLLVAGHETTVNLLGNGILALHSAPEQFAALRADPDLVPAAVEELLRFDGPVNLATVRYTRAATEVGGVVIPADRFVLLSLGSANRDPDRFPDADSLRLDRDAGGHLAFGHGPHYCAGAPLARLETEVALRALLDRFPRLSVVAGDAQPKWRDSMLIRGVEVLRVRLTG